MVFDFDVGEDGIVKSGRPLTKRRIEAIINKAVMVGKTDFDVETGIKEGVGYFVADSLEEIRRVDFFAGKYGKKQKILLRLTPGIDPHTFSAVATGKVDSKFGFSLASGQAAEAGMLAKSLPNVVLDGFHCHIGSQLFDSDVYIASAKIMLGFIKEFSEKASFVCNTLDLGGGYGVRYLPSHPEVDIAKNIDVLSSFIKDECERLGLPLPVIVLEPGRSVVADAGMTVYEVGSVKKIPGYINYVSVDGGMADNVRYAMYDSPYTVLPVELDEKKKGMICTLAGRCCESGDVIQPNIELPEDIKRGDFVAVETTGAYNYSMASNYNRLPRPPVVMIKDGKDFLAVRRESYEDLIRNDL